MDLLTFSILVLSFYPKHGCSSILELGDNFSELRKEGGYWLIKFYAPWCGHCQRLEPLWAEVADALSKTNIEVGRIDCTRHSNIATEFGIRGYPTIKLITTNSDFTFYGERNKDDIIQFATRVSEPPIKKLRSSIELFNIKNLNSIICFVYVGDPKGDLWNIFFNVSKKLQPYAHYYATSEHVAKEAETITTVPTIFVYKENRAYFYISDQTHGNDFTKLNDSLSKWINEERFNTFQKVTYGNLPDLMQLNKLIILVVTDDKNMSENPNVIGVKSMVGKLALLKKIKYKNFIFGWSASPDLANSIVWEKLQLPYIMVFNCTSYEYYIPDTECLEMTIKDMEMFLDNVNDGLLPPLGGSSYIVSLYRGYLETKTAALEMWHGNPLLTSMLFAIPLLFISFIFYSIWFVEILEDEEDDEESEWAHPKNE